MKYDSGIPDGAFARLMAAYEWIVHFADQRADCRSRRYVGEVCKWFQCPAEDVWPLVQERYGGRE